MYKSVRIAPVFHPLVFLDFFFDIFTEMNFQNAALWVVTPCYLPDGYRGFGEHIASFLSNC
jgi:hypothetical protein